MEMIDVEVSRNEEFLVECLSIQLNVTIRFSAKKFAVF